MDQKKDPRSTVLALINIYVSKIKQVMIGESFELGQGIQGAALINEIIEQKFRLEVLATEVDQIISSQDIHSAIKNSNGFRPSLFVS